MKTMIQYWLPPVFWAGLIYFFSSIPGLSSGLDYDTLLRKTAHVVEYFILTFLIYRAFKRTWNLDPLSLLFYPAMISFIYAVSDELHQLNVPNRHGAVEDIWIDSLGVALCWVCMANKEIILKIFSHKDTKVLK